MAALVQINGSILDMTNFGMTLVGPVSDITITISMVGVRFVPCNFTALHKCTYII